MAVVTDPRGVQWSVRRRWWPFGEVFDPAFDGLIGLILVVPTLLLWPLWFAAKGLGVRWRIVVERDGVEVESVLVRGWRRSAGRIDEIALQVARGWRSGHFDI
ncbi:MAG: hypothetical protein PGN27_25305 [Mycolicibacterium neoaurum]|uniref:hypothetical protein n=1 Tax=Mycolicibacterium neoaurum TaxID=1795 RepID=UPI002FF80C46